MSSSPIKVSITGGAGQIAYQLLFRIAAGEVFGRNQSVILQILEIPQALPILEGVQMELEDCAFPMLEKIEISSDPYIGFKDTDIALLIGAKPRTPGMERKDLLNENGKIFVEQGKALNEVAKKDAMVFVIGNPCNTNCLIARSHAPRLHRDHFFAMTRLDQNRATHFLAKKANVQVNEVSHVAIWGNHSSTQVPDFFHSKIKQQPIEKVIQDRHWLENEFFQLVQKRGAAILDKRGKSSSASAAQAVIDAIQDTLYPTSENNWFSSAMDAYRNSYGINEELIFSFPCYTTRDHQVKIVEDLVIPEFLANKLKITERELMEERECIRSLLKE